MTIENAKAALRVEAIRTRNGEATSLGPGVSFREMSAAPAPPGGLAQVQ